jgi:hypothetical protein
MSTFPAKTNNKIDYKYLIAKVSEEIDKIDNAIRAIKREPDTNIKSKNNQQPSQQNNDKTDKKIKIEFYK